MHVGSRSADPTICRRYPCEVQIPDETPRGMQGARSPYVQHFFPETAVIEVEQCLIADLHTDGFAQVLKEFSQCIYTGPRCEHRRG